MYSYFLQIETLPIGERREVQKAQEAIENFQAQEAYGNYEIHKTPPKVVKAANAAGEKKSSLVEPPATSGRELPGCIFSESSLTLRVGFWLIQRPLSFPYEFKSNSSMVLS